MRVVAVVGWEVVAVVGLRVVAVVGLRVVAVVGLRVVAAVGWGWLLQWSWVGGCGGDSCGGGGAIIEVCMLVVERCVYTRWGLW